MTVENKSSLIVAAILLVLIGLALWQFYSLAWADVIRTSYAPRVVEGWGAGPDLAASPWPAAPSP